MSPSIQELEPLTNVNVPEPKIFPSKVIAGAVPPSIVSEKSISIVIVFVASDSEITVSLIVTRDTVGLTVSTSNSSTPEVVSEFIVFPTTSFAPLTSISIFALSTFPSAISQV